ncbi:MAG: zf-HC2 domain-containing protein [Deltaproteobacteria bacterium]|nr:zf-HC2 domain-containing protein [Deltaproteobacteria bacterium]
MNCKELAYLLADYFDGSMDPGLREELDRHIALCEPCMKFANTYRTTCRKTAELRKDIEYRIPDEVRSRLATFIAAALKKYPAQMEEYHRQAEQERREKVAALCEAAAAGRLSTMTSLLIETHSATCTECRGFFDALPGGRHPAPEPPPPVRDHITALLESLPPGEEFFLA